MKNLDIKKTISKFIELWVDETANPFTSFLYQSILHWNVLMLIADSTLNDYEISFEDICEKINSRVGSRTSIQNIIKIGLDKKYLNKIPSKNDARRKIITLSVNGLNEFREFIKKDAECYYYLKEK